MKLSIIVPVYNVEPYITKCIGTLLDQSTEDYEIIVVNDGTRDKSIELIENNFHSKKIKIISQTNQGLSAARNTGMKYAQGEYIWFFDSDDWITPNSLSQIIKELVNCDILYCEASIEERKNKSSKIIKTPNKAINGPSFTKKPYSHGAPFLILRREFLIKNNLSFLPNIFHEDTLFTPCTLYLAKQIKSYSIPVYHRFLRDDSITHVVNPKRCTDLLIVIDQLMKFASSHVAPIDKYKWGNCIAEATNEVMYLSMKCTNSNLSDTINTFLKEHTEIKSYLCHAKKFPTRIMGIISALGNIPLYTLYKILYHIRY